MHELSTRARWIAALIMVLVGGFGVLPTAALEPYEGFQIHGFASQSWIRTSANDMFGSSSDGGGTMEFQELGLNASWRPIPNLQFSAQAISRRAGESDDGSPELDYGIVDWSFLSDAETLLGVRGGRVKVPLGLYNETRDVAFTRPTILLPQSVYFDRTRDLALSGDGAQLYGEHRADWGDLFLVLGGGYPRVDDDEVKASLLGAELPGDLERNLSYSGRLLYERNSGLFRAALSAVWMDVDYDPAFPQPFDLGDGSIQFMPWVFSVQYNGERLGVTSEYALRRFKYEGFAPTVDREFRGDSIYLQGTYRFLESLQAVARYDLLFTDRDDRDGKDFEAETGRPAHSRFAKDLTLGLRWDATPWLMFRGEYHNVDGTAWLPRSDNPNVTDLERRWHLFAIMGALQF